MLFARLFTAPMQDAYTGVEFVTRTSSKTAGSRTVKVPADWSDIAVDIIAGKYMQRAGVPSAVYPLDADRHTHRVPEWLLPAAPTAEATFGGEDDARQVFDRLAGFWAYWGWKLGYFQKPGLPDYREESTDNQSVMSWYAAWDSARVFYDEIRYMLAKQMAAPASPQWFNAGLNWAYGIKGDDQGQWCIREREEITGSLSGTVYKHSPAGAGVKPSHDPYERPALSACFIQGVADNLVEAGGIQDLMRREALVFKYGGGSGSNWSNVRGAGEPLSGGGVSSGLLSFLEAPDKSAGAIKSGGTTRRAARMLCLDDDHPELIQFVKWKATEEKKVAALVTGAPLLAREVRRVYEGAVDYTNAPNDDQHPTTVEYRKRFKRRRRQALGMGVPKALVDAATIAGRNGAPCPVIPDITPDFEGAAYTTVTGQNANNSVRPTNAFLTAAEGGKDWHLYGRLEKKTAKAEGRDPVPLKTVNAAEAMAQMAYAAWECGCPGWQYHTTINEWWTCPNDGPVEASNPCSEYMAATDTACNLASLNLLKFVSGSDIDTDKFQHAARLWTTVLDITVTAAGYPAEPIARGSWNYRTLGLGHTNFGSFLMRRGVPYDSDAGRAWSGYFTALLQYCAGVTSAELAQELGAFPRYADNAKDVQRVIRNHTIYGRFDTRTGDYDGLTFPPEPLCSRPGSDAVPYHLRELVDQLATKLAYFSEVGCGFRNAQLTLLAPNGTIGLLMDCDTTGIEPDFALVKWKKLAGGGFIKIVNKSIHPALKSLGYTDAEAEEVRSWVVGIGRLSAGAVGMLEAAGVPLGVSLSASNAVPGAMKLADCFAPHVVGADEYRRVGLDPTRHTGKDYFTALKISPEWVKATGYQSCGHMTVEGCPVLKPEHLPVFDCANRCGADGVRYLSVDAHLEMMAAAQPVLSGAISKTVNFPADATPDDFQRAAFKSWRLGLKAMAGYRDGSKMAQPLNTDSEDAEEGIDDEGQAVAAPVPKVFKSERRKLPNRVKGERVKLRIMAGSGVHKFYLRPGNYPDGTLGEIFIDCAKEGATLKGIMNAFAMAVSIGLQHGVPLEHFVDTFTFMKFEPNGPITGHDRLRRCDSIIDAIFRELAISYLKRDDLAHVAPEVASEFDVSVKLDTVKATDDIVKALNGLTADAFKRAFGVAGAIVGEQSAGNYAARATASAAAESRAKGFSGNRCPKCKLFMLVRSGACEKCDNCGEQSGCM